MWPWIVSGLILAADQLTKALVVQHLALHDSLPVLPPALYLTYVHNTGAAFGLLKGQQRFFIAVSLVVIAWMAWELAGRPRRPLMVRWGCALVLGGAIGNLSDRLRLGVVIDFIDLRVWPVFNVGDSAITIGVALLILHIVIAPRRCTPSS